MSLLLINLLIAMMSESTRYPAAPASAPAHTPPDLQKHPLPARAGYEEVQGKAQEKYSLAWGRGILAFTIIPGPKQSLRALSYKLSRGRRRPHHHVQVNMDNKYAAGCGHACEQSLCSPDLLLRRVRWMMMLEELNEMPIGASDDKEKSAKKKLARVEEGQRHLDKKMGAVEKKLEDILKAVTELAPK